MDLPDSIREKFRRHGRKGGRRRAANLDPEARQAVARHAATSRWIRDRFGEATFERLALPGGELVDTGIRDLAHGRVTRESLAVSVAAPRLRREGVPIRGELDDPEHRLYHLLAQTEGDLAHARYNAVLQQLVSFANACSTVRTRQTRRAK